MCHEISHMGQYRSGGPGRVGLIQLLNDKSLAGPWYRMAVAPACPCSTYGPQVETERCFPESTPLLLNRFLSLNNVMASKAWIPWTIHSGAWHEPIRSECLLQGCHTVEEEPDRCWQDVHSATTSAQAMWCYLPPYLLTNQSIKIPKLERFFWFNVRHF